MATQAATGKRRAEAIARIEQSCEAMGGGEKLHLPTSLRYGQDMLLVFQLEAIADYLESAQGKTVQPTKTSKAKVKESADATAL